MENSTAEQGTLKSTLILPIGTQRTAGKKTKKGREPVSRERRTLKGKGVRVIEEDGKRGPY